MTQIVAKVEPDRDPVSWSTIGQAGFLTWIGVSGLAAALVGIGAVMPGAHILFFTDIPVISQIVTFSVVLVFLLMFSAIISWAPMIIMSPVVKWIADRGQDTFIAGVILGGLAGGVTGAVVLGSDQILMGIVVGAVFGSSNLMILRYLRGHPR